MKVLGIETSCDETAAAVVAIQDSAQGVELLSNEVASSMEIHAQYGGVIPENAARSHIEVIIPVIKKALADAECTWNDIDAIAVTYGPGLGGSLLIGVLTARTLALVYNKPLYACNHVEAHIYANFITAASPALSSNYSVRAAPPAFPMLAILVSGGHSQLVFFSDHFTYWLLGQTQDDAIGEAFDKVGKMLGLPYPGGPQVAQLAQLGDPHAFPLPKAKLAGSNAKLEELRNKQTTNPKLSQNYDFSFSGLKTAVLRQAQAQIGEDYTFPSIRLPERLSEAQKANIAATFQQTALETIVDKALLAIKEFSPASVVVAGGVAASQALRRQLTAALPLPIDFPDLKLCTDNGAMIAALGAYKAALKQPTADPYSLDSNPSLQM